MMEQVRLCAVRHMENWLGSSFNQIQGWTPVRESYSFALEQGPLGGAIALIRLGLDLSTSRGDIDYSPRVTGQQ